MSDCVEPERAYRGTLRSVPLEPVSIGGNGKSPGCIIDIPEPLKRGSELVLRGDDDRGDKDGDNSFAESPDEPNDSFNKVCRLAAAAFCDRRIWALTACSRVSKKDKGCF